jgi:hypothetical protein
MLEGRRVDTVYLEQAVNYLSPHIVLVSDIQITFQQAEDAFRYAVVGLKVFRC